MLSLMWLLVGGYRNRSKSYTTASLIINSDFVKIFKTLLEYRNIPCWGSAGCSDKQTSSLSPNPKRGRRKTLTTHLNADEWNQDEKFFSSFLSFMMQPATGSCDILVTFIGFILFFMYVKFIFWSPPPPLKIQDGIKFHLSFGKVHSAFLQQINRMLGDM